MLKLAEIMGKSTTSRLSSIVLLCWSGVALAAGTDSDRQDLLGLDGVEISGKTNSTVMRDEGEAGQAESEYDLTIKKYQQAIHETQKNHGAYDDKVWEQLVGLGVAQQNANHHLEAVASLNQALFINRINHGLHNLDQVPIIDLLIKSNTALSDWKALDQNYHYLYWLYRRVYGENDMRLLPVITRVGLWHLNAYQLGDSDNPLAHLMAAQNVYSDAVNIIEVNRGELDPGEISPLYGIMFTNYLMAVYASTSPDSDELRTSIAISNQSYRRCTSSYFSRRDPFFDDCYDQQYMDEEEANRQEVISASYRNGKKALTRMLDVYEKNPALPPEEHAMAYIRLGDWYMLFNRPSSATKTYEKAYSLLESVQSDARERLFGAPRSLPEMHFALTTTENDEPGQDRNYVLVSVDVSKNGRPRNIQVLESNPPVDEAILRRAQRSVKNTRFRPRFENGQPVATYGYKLRYAVN